MVKFCYFNGKIVPVANAVLPVNDISILRGYGIFDFAKVYHGKVFLLKEHLLRLRTSAQKMSLKVPISDKEIAHTIDMLLKKNKMTDATVRLVLTGGPTIDGLSFNPKASRFFILLEEVREIPKKVYAQGATLMTHDFERNFFDIKTTNYITAVKLQSEKKKKKAAEILYVHNGKVLEATTSNFFIFKGDTLITPKDNILIGITRNFVIELAQKAEFQIEERPVLISELNEATEAFISATNKEILPIVKIDSTVIGNGQVGRHTTTLMEMFTHYIYNL